MVEKSDIMWSTEEGNGKPLQYSCLENAKNSMKMQNDRIVKEELPRSVSAQYATGDQWRNSSRKNEGMELKEKQYPVVDMTGDRSKTIVQLQLLQHYWSGHRLGLPWYWTVCLGKEQRSLCCFWDSIQVLHFRVFSCLWWLLHFF